MRTCFESQCSRHSPCAVRPDHSVLPKSYGTRRVPTTIPKHGLARFCLAFSVVAIWAFGANASAQVRSPVGPEPEIAIVSRVDTSAGHVVVFRTITKPVI